MTDIRLTVQGLAVDYPTARVVDNVSFTLGNERLALVGESGSGKSMTARALMGLVRKPGVVSAERLEVLGRDVLTLSARGWRELRGNDIAMVLQDPRYALNPVQSIQTQLEEALTLHQRSSCRARRGGQRRHRRRRSGSAGPQPLSRRTLRRDGTAGDDRPRAAQ